VASNKHLRILSEGVETWNRWRKLNPSIPPDLSRANLEGARLRGISFTGTNLIGANLNEADLTRARLDDADTSYAIFNDAILNQAQLTNSSCIGTHFVNARLPYSELSGANLREANCERATFNFATLENASLMNSNLTNCQIVDANLINTQLKNARCTEANLINSALCGANLGQADFSFADLSRVNLRDSRFDNTILVETIMLGATCGNTEFINTDLSAANGLNTIDHRGPSRIDVDTLYKAGNRVPKSFLRGCGLSDTFLSYLTSLIGAEEAIQYHSCFISYSQNDEEFAKKLFVRMRESNLRAWFAPEHLKGGEKLYDQIDQAIQVHDRLLLVLSKHSMKSEWVKTEIRKARNVEIQENRRKLFPIRLSSIDEIIQWKCFDSDRGLDMAVEVREYHIPDFSDWRNHDSFEAGFKRLRKDLQLAELARRHAGF
jgi:uncharacterized protein YjbI with pentapeptide repeats